MASFLVRKDPAGRYIYIPGFPLINKKYLVNSDTKAKRIHIIIIMWDIVAVLVLVSAPLLEIRLFFSGLLLLGLTAIAHILLALFLSFGLERIEIDLPNVPSPVRVFLVNKKAVTVPFAATVAVICFVIGSRNLQLDGINGGGTLFLAGVLSLLLVFMILKESSKK